MVPNLDNADLDNAGGDSRNLTSSPIVLDRIRAEGIGSSQRCPSVDESLRIGRGEQCGRNSPQSPQMRVSCVIIAIVFRSTYRLHPSIRQ